jgi:hypothetical protein
MDLLNGNNTLFRIAGVAALLDIILSFGETELLLSGARDATEWLYLFQDDPEQYCGIYDFDCYASGR